MSAKQTAEVKVRCSIDGKEVVMVFDQFVLVGITAQLETYLVAQVPKGIEGLVDSISAAVEEIGMIEIGNIVRRRNDEDF